MASVVAGVQGESLPSEAERGAPPWTDARVSRRLVLVALGATLLISRLPEIIARDVLAMDASWATWSRFGVAVALWLGARVLTPLRPLERYLAVMVGVTLAQGVIEAVLASAIWASLVPAATNEVLGLLVTRVMFAAIGVLVLGWAIALGASRTELYLRTGDLNAPTRSRRKDGSTVGWARFGPLAFIALMLLMVWFGGPMIPRQLDLAAAAPFIVIGAVAALLNAFWEETAYRAAPLSMLQRAVGPGFGVLILALWFGLGHYYGGVPSGPMGFIATGSVAVLLGRAMIETRGLGWPLALHFAIDFVIFTFIALASVG